MKPFLDGTASVFAALVTLAICGGAAWFTYLAIQANAAPQWAFLSIAALSAIGLILTFAFLRKAAKGIAPSRDRRRR